MKDFNRGWPSLWKAKKSTLDREALGQDKRVLDIIERPGGGIRAVGQVRSGFINDG